MFHRKAPSWIGQDGVSVGCEDAGLLGGMFVGEDEFRGVFVKFFESRHGDVDHVAGLKEVVADVGLELRWNLEVLHLISGAEEGGAEVVVAAHEHDLELWVALHGDGEIGHDVDARIPAAASGRGVFEGPVEVGSVGAGFVGEVLAIVEDVASVVVDGGVVGGGGGAAEGVVVGLERLL